MGNFSKLLRDFNEFVMFKHTIFSLPFIFIAMIVAAHGWFGWRLFFLGLLATIFARNFAMAVNRYLDRDIDALNPRTASRPSVDGRISLKQQKLFIIINAIGFIVIAYLINDLAFCLSFPFLVVLGGYSYFKRFSETAHLILGLALGLAPIAGVVAVQGQITLWSIFLAIGVMFWVAGFDLLYSLQDIEFDKKMGLYSIPSRFGSECTLFLSTLFHALAVLFWLFFALTAKLGFFGYIAVVVAAIMLYYEHRIVRKDFSKIDRAFFTVNGYLGIIFLILIILDTIAR
ncbi:menaquinone biosynthesis prenyltransferase MqnP [Nitratiruptor sp. YY09-18]|uniref:menaquinone biosynthesis prenyltransferase MqnP n=1 Tax=Nitratiruptor sp. YY09-18 TaxID=2724901 RepID=UPI001915625B|nr:menaquinone biosynthesis prenyltransferase MqnP [Nitratiruptor sp. YY09-18]BCD67440.1 4-hydroxybenzoate polyprenyltransferase [Nitratiruptor sp. YY09-18]